MNPHYYNIIVGWLNENDIYIALLGLLVLSTIGLAFVIYLYIESTFGILFEEDEE